jgi:hypothetical protein
LYNHAIFKQSTPTTGRRVLLSGGPNQYKLAVFSAFRVLVCGLRVLSLRFHPAEQLNHWDLHPCGLSRSHHLTLSKPISMTNINPSPKKKPTTSNISRKPGHSRVIGTQSFSAKPLSKGWFLHHSNSVSRHPSILFLQYLHLLSPPALHSVGDSPRGPLKQRGNPHLNPATTPKHAKPNHAGD